MSKVATGTKKFILIPEAYPLYALGRVFGPRTGPLSKPTPVPIPVIGELLRQTGKDKVTISEVVPTKVLKSGQILKYSDPVRLTLGNYMLPYEAIVGGENESNPDKVVENTTPDIVIQPEVLTYPIEPPKAVLEANAAATAEAAKAFAESEVGKQTITATVASPAPAEEEPVVETEDEAPAEPEAETQPEEQVERAEESENVEKPAEAAPVQAPEFVSAAGDPWPNMTEEEKAAYAQMTKAERKAARKAHREQASEE